MKINDVLSYLYKNDQADLADVVLELYASKLPAPVIPHGYSHVCSVHCRCFKPNTITLGTRASTNVVYTPAVATHPEIITPHQPIRTAL